jgi:hypothetical protein
MFVADGLDARPEALDALKALLGSRSRATRVAAARAWGEFVGLRRYSLRQLKEYRTDYEGLYAVEAAVAPGIAIVIFFSARDRRHAAGVKFLDVVEVIGPAQRAAAEKEAQRYL